MYTRSRLTLLLCQGDSLHVPSADIGLGFCCLAIFIAITRYARPHRITEGLLATVRNPELLSEANKARLELNPGSGEELEENVRELFRLERSLVAKLAEILK